MPPWTHKNVVQCTSCQNYNHKNCTRPYICIKCGGPHDTKTCSKTRDTLAMCALCGGPQPANYKGCYVYQDMLSKHHSNKGNEHNKKTPLPPTTLWLPVKQTNFPLLVKQSYWNSSYPPVAVFPTYIQTLNNQTSLTAKPNLTQFLQEFNKFSTN